MGAADFKALSRRDEGVLLTLSKVELSLPAGEVGVRVGDAEAQELGADDVISPRYTTRCWAKINQCRVDQVEANASAFCPTCCVRTVQRL